MKFSPTMPRNPRFLSAGGAVSAWAALKESTRPGNKALTVPSGEAKVTLGESSLLEARTPGGTAQAVPLAPPPSNGGSMQLGLVCTPKMSLQAAISRVSGTKAGGTGRRILLTEGTWDFPVDGVTVAHEGVEIIALSPGATFFKQNARGTAPILTITGVRVRVQGVTFETNTALAFCIVVQAQDVIIDDCRFTLGRSIGVQGTTHGLCIRNNEFTQTASPAVIIATGPCEDAQIIGNRMRVPGASFTLSDVERAVIVGNTFAPTGVIAVSTGRGNVVVGNTVGPNASSYTLANNATARTTVSGDLAWPVATVFGVTLAYSLYRGNTPDVCTGRIDIAINGADAHVYADYQTTTVNPDVLFYGVVSGGLAVLQYTTSNTGFAATLRVDSIQERRY